MPKTNKHRDIANALLRGDHITALEIASSLDRLGHYKKPIARGWTAHNQPDFFRNIGKDPRLLVQVGIAAVKAYIHKHHQSVGDKIGNKVEDANGKVA